jgi:hypothetical protein
VKLPIFAAIMINISVMTLVVAMYMFYCSIIEHEHNIQRRLDSIDKIIRAEIIFNLVEEDAQQLTFAPIDETSHIYLDNSLDFRLTPGEPNDK